MSEPRLKAIIVPYKLAPLFILLLISGNKECYRTLLGHPSSDYKKKACKLSQGGESEESWGA